MYVGVFFTVILNHLDLLLEGDTVGGKEGEVGLTPSGRCFLLAEAP